MKTHQLRGDREEAALLAGAAGQALRMPYLPMV
jgi:hypothetical protein